VHNYVSLSYASGIGSVISLNINLPISNYEPSRPIADAKLKSREIVRIGGRPVKLASYESQFGEAMVVEWRVNGIPLRATAFNLSPNPRYRLSRDDFVAFLANVR
jgi:hypothetical protein